MASIERQRLPKHILIPDTNILWHGEKDICVTPKFTEFWQEYGSQYEIELALPYVVKGELQFQHTAKALMDLESVNAKFEKLSSYANKTYKNRITENQIKKDISKKFDSWVSSVSAGIISPPVSKIDWESLIDSAIWRRPPFSNDKTEKGFRDALALETVRYIASQNKDIDVAFISNDKLLREAVQAEVKNTKKLSCYESLDDFAAYLKLMDEELTYEFVQAIQKKAIKKFHSAKDDNCLWKREKILLKSLINMKRSLNHQKQWEH